jgi:hypothetical protein
MAWFKDLGAGGHLKEIGHPLDPAGMVVRGKEKIVTDGPFVEAKDIVGGFSVLLGRALWYPPGRDRES